MWKAVLVLFMTSNAQPVSMMVGQFPEIFLSEAKCQAFVAEASNDIVGTVSAFAELDNIDFKVLHHQMSCLESNDGEPV